jgi:hypothetical protein
MYLKNVIRIKKCISILKYYKILKLLYRYKIGKYSKNMQFS